METTAFAIPLRLDRLLTGLALLAAAPVAMAQALIFMNVDGVPGESVYEGKRDWIELTGYSQSFGTADCSRAVANKQVDRASPPLIARAAANRLIPSVVIAMRKAGEGQRDFFTATLATMLVDRIELADQNGRLLERVVLAPRTITIEYLPQHAKGQYGAPVVSTVSCTPSRRSTASRRRQARQRRLKRGPAPSASINACACNAGRSTDSGSGPSLNNA